jgi:hypothetical protein
VTQGLHKMTKQLTFADSVFLIRCLKCHGNAGVCGNFICPLLQNTVGLSSYCIKLNSPSLGLNHSGEDPEISILMLQQPTTLKLGL